MSIIIGNGIRLSYFETELECPICTFVFDASAKMHKAKLPVFKTKCPACKGSIGISIGMYGGSTECFEWETSPNVERLKTVAPFKVNGKPLP